MAQKQTLFIVIAGCGRIGAFLANTLSRRGHNVVIIDRDDAAFSWLSGEFSGFKVEGDAIEFAVLKQSKVEKADVVVAVSEDDNTNLMVAQIAKTLFQVPKVIARVFDRQKEEIYRQSGIEIICPTAIVGDVFFDAVMAQRSAL
ncbi:TrkA-N domain protein [Candidatus Moduliflexus flocculans]|uniref:TrkA-N domain protein n=1 Tax=Candidatus Moduliflexus flocculans TaxID=1499966 RepID=A0A0S6VUD4_9BACT|nr:TrkA-N domain protein [Candidatus Moduliflexus flocculans]